MIKQLLEETLTKGASDLHITVNYPPAIRLTGFIKPLNDQVLSAHETRLYFEEISNDLQQKTLLEAGEVDFAVELPKVGFFRVNAYKQRGNIAIAFRVLAEKIPTIESLGLPEIVRSLSMQKNGLVLVTGATGSGKSTTLASMINNINMMRSAHIITLEDPIEYVHKHKKCLINQREVGKDTVSFASGLRAALREDPDVILLGEMRDLETISVAITAAETGHLVLATLHTKEASQAIERMVDVFPAAQQNQVRVQLAQILQGVIAQQLLPRIGGTGRIAAQEIMIGIPAVKNLIREGKTHQLPNVIQTSSKFGMQTMEMSLQDLYKKGMIEAKEIEKYKNNQG